MYNALSNASKLSKTVNRCPWQIIGNPESCKWERTNIFHAWGRKFLFEQRCKINLIRFFTKVLEKAEAKCSVRNGERFNQTLECLLKASQSVLRLKTYTDKPDVERELYLLERKVTGLRCRLGKQFLTIHQKNAEVNFQDWVDQWKHNSQLIHPFEEEAEKKLWKVLKSFPDFFSLLESHRELRKDFFDWTLKDRLSARIFICYPSLQARIQQSQSEWNGRLNLIAGLNALKTQSMGGQEVVTLPFAGRDINVLDPDLVIKLPEYQTTAKVREVFKTINEKSIEVGDWEMFADGLRPWNNQTWSYKDSSGEEHPVDLSKEEWWFDLPIVQTLSVAAAQNKYRSNTLDGNNWTFILDVTLPQASDREEYYPAEGTHLSFDIAVPRPCGDVQIFPFSVQGNFFPRTFLEKLKVAFCTYPARLAYTDSNPSQYDREHTYLSFPLSPENGKKLMAYIKQFRQECFAGKHLFQIQAENCTKQVFQIAQVAARLQGIQLPNDLFEIDYFQLEPGYCFTGLFRWIRSRSELVRKGFIRLIPLIHNSLTETFQSWFWNRKITVQHPMKLFYAQKGNQISYSVV